MSAQRPPLVPRLLLVLLLFGAEREVICGDLEEEFRTLLDRGDGARMARRWYRRQAWKALGGRLLERVRRVAGGMASAGRGRSGSGGIHESGGTGGGVTMPGDLLRDLRFGLRTLTRQPGFTTVAAVTLALGIGVTTAVFSIMDGVALRPLAYPEAQRIVQVWGGRPLSKSTLSSIRDRVSAFEGASGYEGSRFALTGEGPGIGRSTAPTTMGAR